MKELLQNRLKPFLSNGYLKEYHSRENLSVFSFLDLVYVGFVHTGDEALTGGLLTAAEARVISVCGSDTLIRARISRKHTRIPFSEKTLSRCRTALGRFRLRHKIKRLFYHKAADITACEGLSDVIPREVGESVLCTVDEVRAKALKKYRRTHTLIRVLGFLPLTAMVALPVYLVTLTCFTPERSSVAFDKSAATGAYSYVDIDVLVPFAELYATYPDQFSSPYLGTYFLYGNTQTDTYGLLLFSEASEQRKLFPDEPCEMFFADPIRLYGTPTEVPYQLTDSSDVIIELPTISGSFVTSPDGTQIWVPSPSVPTATLPSLSDPLGTEKNDFSDQAIERLRSMGITIDEDYQLGASYLFATTEPERVTSPLMQTLAHLIIIGLGLSVIFLIPMIVLALSESVKGSFLRSVNQGKLTAQALRSTMPVMLHGQSITINSSAFLLWLKTADKPFELRHAIPLKEKTPTISLFEDSVQTRQYVLQTENDEDFTGKYFLASIRMYLQGKPLAPVLQLDGFISDTPEDRQITLKDIGYRMEGHFLARGGKATSDRLEMNRGQDLPMKGLKYPGYTTPSNIRLVGFCPECGHSFTFHGYAFYMMQNDVAYSEDGLDCCVIEEYSIDKDTWSYTEDGKTFRYYNSFNCPHCGTPYIDYKKYPENKVFGVSGCVHLGREAYHMSAE